MSKAKKRHEMDLKLGEAAKSLATAALRWRHAEIRHTFIKLGEVEGNATWAVNEMQTRLDTLRIECDRFRKLANESAAIEG